MELKVLNKEGKATAKKVKLNAGVYLDLDLEIMDLN